MRNLQNVLKWAYQDLASLDDIGTGCGGKPEVLVGGGAAISSYLGDMVNDVDVFVGLTRARKDYLVSQRDPYRICLAGVIFTLSSEYYYGLNTRS